MTEIPAKHFQPIVPEGLPDITGTVKRVSEQFKRNPDGDGCAATSQLSLEARLYAQETKDQQKTKVYIEAVSTALENNKLLPVIKIADLKLQQETLAYTKENPTSATSDILKRREANPGLKMLESKLTSGLDMRADSTSLLNEVKHQYLHTTDPQSSADGSTTKSESETKRTNLGAKSEIFNSRASKSSVEKKPSAKTVPNSNGGELSEKSGSQTGTGSVSKSSADLRQSNEPGDVDGIVEPFNSKPFLNSNDGSSQEGTSGRNASTKASPLTKSDSHVESTPSQANNQKTKDDSKPNEFVDAVVHHKGLIGTGVAIAAAAGALYLYSRGESLPLNLSEQEGLLNLVNEVHLPEVESAIEGTSLGKTESALEESESKVLPASTRIRKNFTVKNMRSSEDPLLSVKPTPSVTSSNSGLIPTEQKLLRPASQAATQDLMPTEQKLLPPAKEAATTTTGQFADPSQKFFQNLLAMSEEEKAKAISEESRRIELLKSITKDQKLLKPAGPSATDLGDELQYNQQISKQLEESWRVKQNNERYFRTGLKQLEGQNDQALLTGHENVSSEPVSQPLAEIPNATPPTRTLNKRENLNLADTTLDAPSIENESSVPKLKPKPLRPIASSVDSQNTESFARAVTPNSETAGLTGTKDEYSEFFSKLASGIGDSKREADTRRVLAMPKDQAIIQLNKWIKFYRKSNASEAADYYADVLKEIQK